MAELPTYKDLDQKRKFFSNGQKESFMINTKTALDKWFKDVQDEEKEESEIDATAWIYRGMTEAKFKLLTSSQRLWISNEMNQWANKNYIDFISDLVDKANENTLINKVFKLYNYSRSDREFPILSLLQHYGAPTPLMDWTYNNNVAFFFATEGLKKKEEPKEKIDEYFSVYRINKRKCKKELLNIIDFIPKELYPEIKSFNNFRDNNGNPKSNGIFYISDFERKGESSGEIRPSGNLIIRTKKPFTSIYNQNIIPQEGLFIFNPFSQKTLEDIFNTVLNKDGWNLALTPFDCFNIHKDLAEYLRRKIDIRFKINKSFIYPDLNDEARKIKESTLNGLI
jgi:hypothetical protein